MEYIIIWVAAAVLGGAVASGKNRSAAGWATICLLLPIAILVLFALPTIKEEPTAEISKKCPDCAEQVQPDARICRHCGHEFTKTVVPSGPSAKKSATNQTDIITCAACNKETYAGQDTCPHCDMPLMSAEYASITEDGDVEIDNEAFVDSLNFKIEVKGLDLDDWDDDDDEDFDDEENDSKPFKFDPGPVLLDGLDLNWILCYFDKDDNETQRPITVKALHGEKYPKYIQAYCHLRKAPRFFNIYNIEEAIDAKTGELIPVLHGLLEWIEHGQPSAYLESIKLPQDEG